MGYKLCDYNHCRIQPVRGVLLDENVCVNALAGHKLSSVEFPSTTVLIFETSHLSRNASGSARDLAAPRHIGWNNFCFCDGSVSHDNMLIAKTLRWSIR